MIINPLHLYIYKEIKDSFEIFISSLDKKDHDKKSLLVEFFNGDLAKKAFFKGIKNHYEELKELKKDLPEDYQQMVTAEDEENLEIEYNDVLTNPDAFYNPGDAIKVFEATREYIIENEDVYRDTEYWSEELNSIESIIGKKNILFKESSDNLLEHEGEVAVVKDENKSTEDHKKIDFDKFYHKNFEEKEMEVDFDEKIDASLEQKYEEFLQSSLYQNAMTAKEGLNIKKDTDFRDVFYQSINGADEIKILACLMLIFENGVVDFFAKDKRYADFMGKYLAQRDKEEMVKFDANKIARKYIVLFLRLILEQKLKRDYEESAVIGTYLALLAKENREADLAEIAFGDEETGTFEWVDV